jgi:cyclohexyl-isocyanide hydratase
VRDLRLHWISHARRCGLLKGYEATTHWGWHEILSSLGVKPVQKRVVRDRNRLSGGGVTAGLDFGLKLLAILGGEEAARTVQLLMEYDPAPPFNVGNPEKAGHALVENAQRILKARAGCKLTIEQQQEFEFPLENNRPQQIAGMAE